MNSKQLVLSALTVALLATSGLSFAREASEGPRGNDRVHTGTHKNSVEADTMILARRGADDPIPHPRGEGVGHPNSVDVNGIILARRGADDPVGSERLGEVHGQKRGSRNSVEITTLA